MNNWRAGLIGVVVGGFILFVGWFVPRLDDGATSAEPVDTGGVTTIEVDQDIVLACVEVLATACRSAAEGLGVATDRWRPGDPLPDPGVLIAPTGEIPAEAGTGTDVGTSPIVVAAWRTRWQLIELECQTVDQACVAELLGSSWSELGGSSGWGDLKLGLADPTGSESGMLAWSTLAPHLGPQGFAGSLRLTSEDDATLMAELVQFGDSRADVVITTEVAVLGQFQNAIQRGDGRLELGYPAAGPWATYAAVGNGRGAEDLVERLLSEEIAIRFTQAGLRPVGGMVGQPTEGMGEAGERSADPDDATRESLLSLWEELA